MVVLVGFFFFLKMFSWMFETLNFLHNFLDLFFFLGGLYCKV